MFKKKIGIYALTLVMAAAGITGCSSVSADKSEGKGKKTAADGSESFSVVCTIFPEYDWTKEILGDHADNVEITYLLDNGVDLHSYQPTAEDILKISTCDLFVYVGGESDEWVEDVLETAQNKDMKVINLMEVLGDSAKVEELKEGMQESEHEHEHEHKTDFEDSDVKDRTLDEWNGSWQSTYPLLLDGSLDEVWEHKAEEDDTMTAEDYKKKYTTAYETDVVTININAPEVEYVTADKSIKAEYDYSGFYIRTKDDGTKQVRYKFEKKSGDDSAAKYIVFSDHNIEPSEPEHFHLYSGNDGFDTLVEEGDHFPTYYPASLTAEDIVDEMTGGHEHSHAEEEEEEEYDEHVWLSLKNAMVLSAEIEQNIAAIDPANADDYKANLDNYVAKLSELDNNFKTLVDGSSVKTLIFGDRFPFRYFVDDYGLDYFAAFIGCSAETEASFDTVVFLADKVKELDIKTIFTLENSSKDIANTIISTSGKDVDIAELNSLQSVSNEDIENGASYISLMQKNYDVLAGVLK
ncbi:MAG: zinc ABC transporter substrate-binding protein [Ruminococcus sp.]|uniref:metal ABC transporter solute-binding protein, Zn/Mn family n=1 Tax=Ruminococcus sp. TaxID=41978 RepID=UPI0025DEDAE1|nr:ZinT/AdcA family metal-binding protein [Ruminococcus sp.]MBO4867656.1 zinc ABC transporter substrate-binding protein [Ruminococcus sp.]